MRPGSIILLGALICAVLLLLPVDGDGTVPEAAKNINKWNSSDIWKNLPNLPEKWGEQYDLKLGESGCTPNEFAPIVALPEEMVKDLFAIKQTQEEQVTVSTGLLEKGRNMLKSLVSRVSSTLGSQEKLDEASGKLKNMLNDFQNKKTDAVKNVKAKLDRKTNEVERQLKDVSNEFGCEESTKKCVENAKGSFEEYQKSLQVAMNPCLNEMHDAIKGHESRIDAANREVDDLLQKLKDCSAEQTSNGIKERLSATFGTVKCTAKTLANQMTNQLATAMTKLMEAVKKAGNLKKEVNGASKCIKEPPTKEAVEEYQRKLLEKLGKCKS